jgi:hypothetical protein
VTLLAYLLLASLILGWPAMCNGYPFVFGDTGEYIKIPIGVLDVGWFSPAGSRPPFSGISMSPFPARLSMWPIIIVQGLVVAHLVYLVWRATIRKATFLLSLGSLIIFPAFIVLPWHVIFLVPDVFAGVAILGMFMLVVRPRSLKAREIIYIFGLTTAAMHRSTVKLVHIVQNLSDWMSEWVFDARPKLGTCRLETGVIPASGSAS